ncbi:stage II sporulation protein P [Halobacillus sp. A1]|uniref:stage II sporulation protein P n=1 Tax=Halobacillus sp. A1 TaxID=2880262 RepID=UPI0020A652AC|nr:stage II sporulation protein P [Halobacillus sp. A1]MCP3030371.1 stage II sporulation protein P [Halobacillus sp. A1]
MGSIQKFKKKHSNLFKRWSVFAAGTMAILLLLFIGIGLLTGAKSTYKLYSTTIQNFTTQVEGSSFLYLFEMENRLFKEAHPDGSKLPGLSSLSFQLFTSIKPHDLRSLLGREIPGLSAYNSEIVIAGEGTDYTNLPFESQPPLDVVLEDREAVDDGDSNESEKEPAPEGEGKTIKENSVFIYHTHNRESYFPHLPEGTTDAYHDEVNITKVGDRLGEALERHGIGAHVDHTDITTTALEKSMDYYDVSRGVVQEAMASNDRIKYLFDLHRDNVPRDVTTKEINGKTYARTIFVVGAKHPDYEKNLKIATDLHKLLEESYPGLSRGVLTKQGSGVDGKYNQDLSGNAVLIEFGGVYNDLDETYLTADVIAEVFSEYYWQAEEVSSDE